MTNGITLSVLLPIFNAMNVDKRILSFLLMAFGIVWVIAAVGIFGLRIDTNSGTSYIIMAALCMLAPASRQWCSNACSTEPRGPVSALP